MKLEITETIKKTYNFTWDIFIKTIVGDTRGVQKDRCMKILSELLKKYRWELFETYAGYRIITNGYGGVNRIEIGDRTIKKQELVRRLKEIYEDEKAQV